MLKFNPINALPAPNPGLVCLHVSGRSRGGARGPVSPPLFWLKNEEITEERKASRASKTTPPPPMLAQRLDLPLLNALAFL